MTLLVSRSQHLTILSSPHENRYGCRGETARPRTVDMWPVSVSRKLPEAKPHILIVLSPAPLANHSLPGSTARALTQPKCPEITRMSFHGACHSGLGCCMFGLRTRLVDVEGRPPDLVWPSTPLLLTRAICFPFPAFCTLGRFIRPAAVALACFSASARGNSFTS